MFHNLQFPEGEDFHLPSVYLTKCQHYSKTHPLFSYVFGMLAVQIAFTSLGHTDNEVDKKSAEDTLTELLDYLESMKQKKISKDLDTSFQVRSEVCKQLDKKYHHLTSIITSEGKSNNENVNFGQFVELLLELGLLYEALRGLYPENGFEEEEERREISLQCPDEKIGYRIHYCKTQASTILSVLKSGQNPNDYMQQLRMVPVEDEQDSEDGITKEQVDEMIKQVMELPDDALPDAVSENESEEDRKSKNSDDDDDDEDVSSDEGTNVRHVVKPGAKKGVFDLPSAPKDSPNLEKDRNEDADKKEADLDHDKDEVAANSKDSKAKSDQEDNTKTPIAPNNKSADKNTQKSKDCDNTETPVSPKPHIPAFHHTKPRDYTREEISVFIENDKLLDAAMRDAKHAVSALNYEDCDTALTKLEDAIHLVKEYKSRLKLN